MKKKHVLKTIFLLLVLMIALIPIVIVEKAKPHFLHITVPYTAKNQVHISKKVIYMLQTKKSIHLDKDLRKFPYPYGAMLSICSDIDGTTLEEFEQYHKFLNTKAKSIYGTGLGLDVADSFWVYMGIRNENSAGINYNYIMTAVCGTNINQFNKLDKIKYYYDRGWIDSIHTFGDFSEKNANLYVEPTRKLAIDAWKLLNKYNIKPVVWINHGDEKNVQNFGGYSKDRVTRYQQGDNPASKCYHTDITMKNGIRFLWDSLGSEKFGLADPLYRIRLRDGQNIWGFYRYTDKYSRKKISWLWTPDKIDRQITVQNLDSIVKRNEYSIIGMHFGEGKLLPNGVKTLRILSDYQNKGKILVARTSRLLQYDIAQKYVKYAVASYNGIRYINIKSIDDPLFGPSVPTLEKLRGITFYTSNARKTVLMINDLPVSPKELVTSRADTQTIGIKWFASDFTDYTNSHAQRVN